MGVVVEWNEMRELVCVWGGGVGGTIKFLDED